MGITRTGQCPVCHRKVKLISPHTRTGTLKVLYLALHDDPQSYLKDCIGSLKRYDKEQAHN